MELIIKLKLIFHNKSYSYITKIKRATLVTGYEELNSVPVGKDLNYFKFFSYFNISIFRLFIWTLSEIKKFKRIRVII